jgi:hypothetical protein
LQAVSRSASSAHFGTLVDRLNLAIESVENTRELLVGSFDMFTTQTTLRTNEVIKVLALVSAVLFPASVGGVSGLRCVRRSTRRLLVDAGPGLPSSPSLPSPSRVGESGYR